jgi:hypothetical protein
LSSSTLLNDGAVVHSELKMLEEALPRALQNEPIWKKVIDEVKIYHRWFGIIFHHSPYFPRVLRIVSVGSNIVIVLFIQAVTYNITDPNNGSCEQEKTMEGCLRCRRSSCVWNDTTSRCEYHEVAETVNEVVSVAILCSLLSAPLALFVQLIISKILTVPTEVKEPEQAEVHLSLRTVTILRSANRVKHTKQVEEIKATDVLQSYRELLGKIREFRCHLTNHEKEEFDGI